VVASEAFVREILLSSSHGHCLCIIAAEIKICEHAGICMETHSLQVYDEILFVQ